MPTPLETYQAQLDQVNAAITVALTSPKPTYNLDGKMFSWVEYYRFLCEERDKLIALVNRYTPGFNVPRVQGMY